MTLDEVIAYFGSPWKACMVLNLRAQNATYWKEKGYIPPLQQYRLEKITNGALLANPDTPPPKNRMLNDDRRKSRAGAAEKIG